MGRDQSGNDPGKRRDPLQHDAHVLSCPSDRQRRGQRNVDLPFVGRILDWYKKSENRDYSAQEDPGVLSVTQIYNYYKKFGYKTQIMGASFRSSGEILELAGCDLLTLQPKFLAELQQATGSVPRKLDPEAAKKLQIEKFTVDEKTFRWMMCMNPMASEKLNEGIVSFAKDIIKLEDLIKSRMKAA